MGDTPEYHWDTGYEGIQGFSSRLRNRVSETSTPQGGQSPRGGPRTPPEPQRQFKQLKVLSGYHADTPITIKAEPSIWPTAAFINIHEHPI